MRRGVGCTCRAATIALALALGACRSTKPATEQSAPPGEGAGDASASEAEAAQGDEVEATEETATDETTEGESAEGGPALHGMLSTRYRGRWSGDDSDNDIFQVVALDYGDPLRDRTSASIMGRVSADLDGRTDGSTSLISLEDTYDSAVQGELYYAYATLRDRGPFEVVRAGRQWLHDTPEFAWFDGLYLESHEYGGSRLRGAAYGGASVHPYESSTEGDGLAGGWLEAWPWEQGRARVDYMHAEDETLLGSHANDLLGIGLWQHFGNSVSAELQHTRIDGEARDLRAAASWLSSEQDLSVNFSYYQLLETQGELALEFDPFFAALHELFPYNEARLSVSKGFGTSLRADAGVDLRRVRESGDIGEFNRDFDRGFLTLVFPELLPEKIVLSATGDWWNASGSDITSGGAELSRAWNRLEAAAGSYYALFQYDWSTGEERDEVRVWYLRLRWKGAHDLDHEVRYEYDDDDFQNVQSLRWVSTWHF
jgi:hypothetical protein